MCLFLTPICSGPYAADGCGGGAVEGTTKQKKKFAAGAGGKSLQKTRKQKKHHVSANRSATTFGANENCTYVFFFGFKKPLDEFDDFADAQWLHHRLNSEHGQRCLHLGRSGKTQGESDG